MDINNDGWEDIYFTCTAYDDSLKRRNKFYINLGLQEDGQLLFEEKAESFGIADDSYSVHSAFFDYDRDGDLDLYVTNFTGAGNSQNLLYRNEGNNNYWLAQNSCLP